MFVVAIGMKPFSLWFKGSKWFSLACSALLWFGESLLNVVWAQSWWNLWLLLCKEAAVTLWCIALLGYDTGYPCVKQPVWKLGPAASPPKGTGVGGFCSTGGSGCGMGWWRALPQALQPSCCSKLPVTTLNLILSHHNLWKRDVL